MTVRYLVSLCCSNDCHSICSQSYSSRYWYCIKQESSFSDPSNLVVTICKSSAIFTIALPAWLLYWSSSCASFEGSAEALEGQSGGSGFKMSGTIKSSKEDKGQVMWHSGLKVIWWLVGWAAEAKGVERSRYQTRAKQIMAAKVKMLLDFGADGFTSDLISEMKLSESELTAIYGFGNPIQHKPADHPLQLFHEKESMSWHAHKTDLLRRVTRTGFENRLDRQWRTCMWYVIYLCSA